MAFLNNETTRRNPFFIPLPPFLCPRFAEPGAASPPENFKYMAEIEAYFAFAGQTDRLG